MVASTTCSRSLANIAALEVIVTAAVGNTGEFGVPAHWTPATAGQLMTGASRYTVPLICPSGLSVAARDRVAS